MAATIIILPVMRRPGEIDEHMLQIALGKRDFGRLQRQAAEWKISVEEAAAELVRRSLAPKK